MGDFDLWEVFISQTTGPLELFSDASFGSHTWYVVCGKFIKGFSLKAG